MAQILLHGVKKQVSFSPFLIDRERAPTAILGSVCTFWLCVGSPMNHIRGSAEQTETYIAGIWASVLPVMTSPVNTFLGWITIPSFSISL